jgi:hypothetical protein
VGDFNIHVDVPSEKLAVTFLELIETFEQEEEND